MVIKGDAYHAFVQGLIFASKIPHHSEVFYYQKPHGGLLTKQSALDHIEIGARPVIFATTEDWNIAVTHFTWNPKGEEYYEPQAHNLKTLLSFLEDKPPHILCGDMNIPRGINPLHPQLVENYQDVIPSIYTSSLDSSLHRCGKDPEKNMLFTDFMVDYLLLQQSYTATDVKLHFGVSDHAAVVATLERTTP